MVSDQLAESTQLYFRGTESHSHSYAKASKFTGVPPHLKNFIAAGVENRAQPGVVYRNIKKFVTQPTKTHHQKTSATKNEAGKEAFHCPLSKYHRFSVRVVVIKRVDD